MTNNGRNELGQPEAAKDGMFVRFVVGVGSDNPYTLTGIITIARELRDSGKLEPFEMEWVNEIFGWFNENLPKPPFQSKLASQEWTHDAVAWFRPTAGEFIARMWDLTALLREHGVQVLFVQRKHPGHIVYEDQFQVVAETPLEELR